MKRKELSKSFMLMDQRTMLDQRLRRWAHVVQMVYKCFVFAGMDISIIHLWMSTSHVVWITEDLEA